jgi:hypothetical protein
MRSLQLLALSVAIAALPASAQFGGSPWQTVAPEAYPRLADDDIDRHSGDPAFLEGVKVAERRFWENGFDWHLIRFENTAKPDGPLWVVPHDDENAAFDAMIAAIRAHGGVGIAVNTAPSGKRRQSGYGTCGGRAWSASGCDPNRNFDAMSPLFTAAFLYDYQPGQPVIALHTNSPGYGGDGQGGRGDITILDADAYVSGIIRPRSDGHFGSGTVSLLNDPDVYAILPYASAVVPPADAECRKALNASGIHVWHEQVVESDSSLSNYLALNRPDVRYVNMEAKREPDLSSATEAQRLMIAAYLARCAASGNQPATVPATGD